MNSNSSSNPQSMATSSTSAAPPSNDTSGKKVRKPYTITKSRESWTDEEHDKFLEALQLFDRDWKKIEDFVGSKTVIQIRSHAQKYFLKVQKNGAVAHVPPPRPKRKATHPYPQKAPKIVEILVPLQASAPHPSITTFTITPGQSQWDDSSVLLNAPSSSDMLNQDEFANFPVTDGMNHFSDVGSKSTAGICNNSDRALPVAPETRKAPVLHGLPDFAKVYSFIGSVFDPDTKGHMHELKDMDPINFETVLLLMRNLTFNLSSPDFEPVEKLLSSIDLNAKMESVSFGVVPSDVRI